MGELILEVKPKARKDHDCMACDLIRSFGGVEFYQLTFTERRQWVKAKKNNYRILKGQKYIKQCCKQDGEIYTYKAIPEIHEICIKYCEMDL